MKHEHQIIKTSAKTITKYFLNVNTTTKTLAQQLGQLSIV